MIVCLSIAMFCFTFVFWLKKSENKFKYQKTKMVETFSKQRNIHIDKFYSGSHFDLINDLEHKQLWFFVLQNNTLQYKNIPYEEVFQVDFKLDGHTVKTSSRSGQLKRELIGGKIEEDISSSPAVWKKSKEISMVKEIRLTLLIDDLKATTLDLIFNISHLPVHVNQLKDRKAKEWFTILHDIIEMEERKRA